MRTWERKITKKKTSGRFAAVSDPQDPVALGGGRRKSQPGGWGGEGREWGTPPLGHHSAAHTSWPDLLETFLAGTRQEIDVRKLQSFPQQGPCPCGRDSRRGQVCSRGEPPLHELFDWKATGAPQELWSGTPGCLARCLEQTEPPFHERQLLPGVGSAEDGL